MDKNEYSAIILDVRICLPFVRYAYTPVSAEGSLLSARLTISIYLLLRPTQLQIHFAEEFQLSQFSSFMG